MEQKKKNSATFDISDLPDAESIEAYIAKQEEIIIEVSKPRRLGLIFTILLLVIAATVFVGGSALVANGAIHPARLINIFLMALMFVIIALVCVFWGYRPANRKYKQAKNAIDVLKAALEEGLYAGKFQVPELVEEKEPAEEAALLASDEEQEDSEEKPGGVASVLTKNDSNEAMNEFFRIFERGVRNPLVPDLPEYKALRRKWGIVMGIGFALMILSLALMYFFPSQYILFGLLLVISYVILIGGIVWDQKKLKPIRSAWARRERMTEFEMRYNMRYVSKNNKYHQKKDE